MLPRYQLGDKACVTVQAKDSSNTPALPTAAPVLRVYNTNGAKIAQASMPPLDANGVTGLFQHCLTLDDSWRIGVYAWRVSGTVSGEDWVETGLFEIVDGGGQDGAVISMFFLETPAGTHMLYQVDSDDGVLLARNPRV